jgi:DNA glycosylase AlkZ-like
LASAPTNSLLRRHRIAAQRLAPETAAATATEAARAVCGIQAQDIRASHLALRSRVPGLEREDIAAADLVRTWTVRGTVHLIAAGDLPWLHALCSPRFGRRFESWIEKRGGLETARGMRSDVVEILAERPLDRARLLAELYARGHSDLGPNASNVFMPWLASQGLIAGLADGSYRAVDPPAPVEEDEALATMARRYLEGYGPATADDLAYWSGLPLGAARRGFAAAGPLDEAAELMAIPGTLEVDPPPAPPPQLLAAFDTLLLGWRSRQLLLGGHDQQRLLPGSGIVSPIVLARGGIAGTWRLGGSGARRRVEITWFGRPAAKRALQAEAKAIGTFLHLPSVPELAV